jgi:ribosome-binding protein aMBF1 (putative translation factor)
VSYESAEKTYESAMKRVEHTALLLKKIYDYGAREEVAAKGMLNEALAEKFPEADENLICLVRSGKLTPKEAWMIQTAKTSGEVQEDLNRLSKYKR